MTIDPRKVLADSEAFLARAKEILRSHGASDALVRDAETRIADAWNRGLTSRTDSAHAPAGGSRVFRSDVIEGGLRTHGPSITVDSRSAVRFDTQVEVPKGSVIPRYLTTEELLAEMDANKDRWNPTRGAYAAIRKMLAEQLARGVAQPGPTIRHPLMSSDSRSRLRRDGDDTDLMLMPLMADYTGPARVARATDLARRLFALAYEVETTEAEPNAEPEEDISPAPEEVLDSMKITREARDGESVEQVRARVNAEMVSRSHRPLAAPTIESRGDGAFVTLSETTVEEPIDGWKPGTETRAQSIARVQAVLVERGRRPL